MKTATNDSLVVVAVLLAVMAMYQILASMPAMLQNGGAAQEARTSLLASDSYRVSELPDDPGRVFQLLDLRGPDDYEEFHISGAVNLGTDELVAADALLPFDRNVPVLVYSGEDSISQRVVRQLRERGFGEVFYLEGGMDAWHAARRPVVSLDSWR